MNFLKRLDRIAPVLWFIAMVINFITFVLKDFDLDTLLIAALEGLLSAYSYLYYQSSKKEGT